MMQACECTDWKVFQHRGIGLEHKLGLPYNFFFFFLIQWNRVSYTFYLLSKKDKSQYLSNYFLFHDLSLSYTHLFCSYLNFISSNSSILSFPSHHWKTQNWNLWKSRVTWLKIGLVRHIGGFLLTTKFSWAIQFISNWASGDLSPYQGACRMQSIAETAIAIWRSAHSRRRKSCECSIHFIFRSTCWIVSHQSEQCWRISLAVESKRKKFQFS